MVVDTGAEATTVTPAAADALGLTWMSSNDLLLGVGGAVRGGSVRLNRLQLGTLRASNMALDVGDLPPLEGPGRPVAGLLGQDLLGRYDIELDLVRQVMTLYAVPACPGFVPPGYRRADAQAIERAGGGLLFTSVEINGKTVRALIDTGARSSLLARRTAHGLGVTAAELERDPVATGRGIGSIPVAFQRHRFEEVRIGDVVLHDMTLNVAPLPIAGIDMLLGADWLAGRRVWLSRAAGRLFQE
jgi:predicted aspartyl protease